MGHNQELGEQSEMGSTFRGRDAETGNTKNNQSTSETTQSLSHIKSDNANGEINKNAEFLQKSDRIDQNAIIKHPIFIGTVEQDVLLTIEKALFLDTVVKDNNTGKLHSILDKDEYQLVAITTEIFKKLNEQYLFSLLEEAEQKRQQQLNLNEEAYHEAATRAIQLDEFIRRLPSVIRKSLSGKRQFTHGQLKHIYKHYKVPMTDELTWTLIDFLTIKGFLYAVNYTNGLPREKLVFKLTLNNTQRLKSIEDQQKQVRNILSGWLQKSSELENRVEELKIKIKEEQDVILKNGEREQVGTDSRDERTVVGDSTSK